MDGKFTGPSSDTKELTGVCILQEAASHVSTAEKEEVRAVEHALEDVFESPRPRHDTLEKLISLKVCSD